jgi:hydrogenase maturation protease
MIIVVGVGQSYRGDDEAGLAAVRLWSERFSPAEWNPELRVELAESPGLGLLSLLSGAETAILVDAVQSGMEPGTVHLLAETDLIAFLAGSDSAHGWGIAETLALGRSIDPGSLPDRIILIGIEIAQVEPGIGLSSTVASAIPRVASLIQETVERVQAA